MQAAVIVSEIGGALEIEEGDDGGSGTDGGAGAGGKDSLFEFNIFL